MNRQKQSIRLLVLLAILAAGAFADDPSLSSGWAMIHDLPPEMSATETTRTVVGDFTGDLRPDVCMLAAGTAYLSFAPNCFPTVDQIPDTLITLPIKDIEFLPRDNGPGALLFLTDNGIEVVSTGPEGYVHEGTVSGYGWGLAQAFSVLDYNGDGRPDVVGISGNRLRLLRIRTFDGNQVFENDTPGSCMIYELEPLDWTGDGKDEVGVRLDDRVEIRVPGQRSALDTLQTPEAPVLLQGVGFPEQADRLAVIAWSGGGLYQSLHLFGQGGSSSETCLGLVNITATQAGDTDGDGDEDLALVRRTCYLMPYLVNRYETEPEQPFLADPESVYIYLASGLAADNNRAEPVLFDLDNDTDLDLAMVIGDSKQLLVQRNSQVAEDHQWVQISDDPEETELTIQEFPLMDQLNLVVVEPLVNLIDWNRIEIRVWKQDDINSPAVLYRERTLLVTEGFTRQSETFEINEQDTPFVSVYTFEFRAVVKEAGVVTAAGPSAYFFYTTDPATYDELRLTGIGLPNGGGPWYVGDREELSYYGGIGPTPSGPNGPGGFQSGGTPSP